MSPAPGCSRLSKACDQLEHDVGVAPARLHGRARAVATSSPRPGGPFADRDRRGWSLPPPGTPCGSRRGGRHHRARGPGRSAGSARRRRSAARTPSSRASATDTSSGAASPARIRRRSARSGARARTAERGGARPRRAPRRPAGPGAATVRAGGDPPRASPSAVACSRPTSRKDRGRQARHRSAARPRRDPAGTGASSAGGGEARAGARWTRARRRWPPCRGWRRQRARHRRAARRRSDRSPRPSRGRRRGAPPGVARPWPAAPSDARRRERARGSRRRSGTPT